MSSAPSAVPPAAAAAAPWRLRILSWNLWELRGDVAALCDAVGDLQPDVLLVQEAPRLVLPSARLAWLARRLERRVLVGGGIRGRGLAILATDDVAARVIRRGVHGVARTLSDLDSTYPRGVAAVRVSIPGGGAAVLASTHLALREDDRLHHAEHLAALAGGAGAPVVLGGDFNETADGAARRLLARRFADPAGQVERSGGSSGTFPAAAPSRRIDAVLVTEGIRVRAAHAVHSTRSVDRARLAGASDHLPALLDIDLGSGSGRSPEGPVRA